MCLSSARLSDTSGKLGYNLLRGARDYRWAAITTTENQQRKNETGNRA